jgi:hypothetical protein
VGARNRITNRFLSEDASRGNAAAIYPVDMVNRISPSRLILPG